MSALIKRPIEDMLALDIFLFGLVWRWLQFAMSYLSHCGIGTIPSSFRQT